MERWPHEVMPLSACHHNSNIIRKCGEALTSLGYLVFLLRRQWTLLFLKESRLTWKRQFCQMGSLLSRAVLWRSYLTGTCLNSISFSQQCRCWLHLSGVGMYHLITRSRKMNIDWGEKVLIFVNRSVTDLTWWQT